MSGKVQIRASSVSASTIDSGAPLEVTTHEDGAVTDGPFAESVEQLGGYYVIDVPEIDDAVALAKLLPKHFAVEVRPTQGVQIR